MGLLEDEEARQAANRARITQELLDSATRSISSMKPSAKDPTYDDTSSEKGKGNADSGGESGG